MRAIMRSIRARRVTGFLAECRA
ncbi:hypothetical protein RB2654_14650 [Rhodobacterales bacterium HTCC2654]|uniref:Uncharacterized protein n=1 Tax=Maritimibacter alkaliphilus HTCC2654 TaxID=314271 RepID=A3VGX9_9RHOB|nr:hypothetical protein RB2654_14650 [Rhodobacterales bacterium HTCC2654] [Maritimibacter alkaliphilus HTCC2654]